MATTANKRGARENNRRPDTEQLLDGNGIKWKYVEVVPIDQIERHRDAQSRMGDVDKDRVKRFAEQKKNGAIFPPIVIWANGFDNYGVIDGNTRVESDRLLHRTETSAYLLEDLTTTAEAVFVSALFNATNGQELSKEELRRAVVLAAEMPHPPTNERLARLFGVTPATITKIQTVYKVSGDLTNMGIDPTKLSDSNLAALNKVADVAVRRDFAQLIMDAEIPPAEVRDILKDVTAKRSEAERLAVVTAARAARADAITAVATGRNVGASPQRESAMVYGRLVKLIDDYPVVRDWVPVDATRRDEHAVRIQRIVDHLSNVLTAIQAETPVTA